jgi:hypothetical protein
MSLTELKPHFPSICIPRVHSYITKKYIQEVFEKLEIDGIHKIELFPTKKSEKDNEDSFRVFIHFKKWSSSDNAIYMRNRLIEGKDVKIIYDKLLPWYWKMTAFRELTPELIALKKNQKKDYSK